MDHKAFPCKSRRAMSVEEKQKLVKDLRELLRGKMTEKQRSILQKYNLCCKSGSIGVNIGGIDDEVLWEVKRITNCLLKLPAAKIEPKKVIQNRVRPLFDTSRVCSSTAKVKPPASSVDSQGDSCCSFSWRCKMTHRGHKVVCRTDCYKENLTASCANGSSGSVVEEAAKKALRVAKLKRRFAETIFRASQKTLFSQGGKADLVKLQREKDRPAKRHCEEKAKIEAQIVAD